MRTSGSIFKFIGSSPKCSIQSAKSFNLIPGPRPLPLIGNIWRYLPIIGQYRPGTLAENARYNYKKYGPIVREAITKNLTVLHLFRPNDIEALFRQDGKYPHRRSHRALLKYRRSHPDLYQDGGLFPENGPSWYRQRMQFQTRMMSKSQVFANSKKLDSVSLKAINKIEHSFDVGSSRLQIGNFELNLYEWALGNSLALFLDLDIYNLDAHLVEELICSLHEALSAIDKTEIQTQKWIKSPNKCPYYKMLSASQDNLYKFVSNSVSQASPSTSDVSYLHDWIHVDQIDRRDVISFIIDLLLAGLHTTSYTVACLLKNIANNEKIVQRLRKEIEENIPHDGFVTGDKVEELALLRNCLRESLRLDAVSIGTGRLVEQDKIVIDSFEVPKGTQIITQNQVISRDPTIYEQPDRFDPDRWSKYRLCPREQRPSPFATLPFGFGTRACIGHRLAELQIKIFVARLIQRYNFETKDTIPVKTTLINNIGGPIEINLTKI